MIEAVRKQPAPIAVAIQQCEFYTWYLHHFSVMPAKAGTQSLPLA